MDKCKYYSLCRKQEMYLTSDISYWPRDNSLMPYCAGEEESGNCSVFRYWMENPEAREAVNCMKSPEILYNYGITGLGLGTLLLFLGNIAAPLPLLTGAYALCDGASRMNNGKGLLRWLKSRNDRCGVDEIWGKINGMCEYSENAELEPGDFFGSLEAESVGKRVTNIRGINVLFEDVRNARFRNAPLSMAKLSLTYPLIENSGMPESRPLGVVASCKYDIPGFTDDEGEKAHGIHAEGILTPVIGADRMKEGTGFIIGSRMVPVGSATIQDGENAHVRVGCTMAMQGSFSGFRKLFGDMEAFDSITKGEMQEKDLSNARNLHNLMQEALYSEF